MNTVVHTLGYNVAELIREATDSLYKLNPTGNFHHVIADLGYPLGPTRAQWESVNENAKQENAHEIIDIGFQYGSDVVRLPNVGVSQNWTSIAALYGVGEGDLLIGADPDERPITPGWVDAMSTVAQADPNIAIIVLTLPELLALDGFYDNYFMAEVDHCGVRTWYGKHACQWALIGITGNFIAKVGGVPHHTVAPIYGWIEGACLEAMNKLGMRWVMLPDYLTGHISSAPLAQQWKNYVVQEQSMNEGQKTFEQWLSVNI